MTSSRVYRAQAVDGFEWLSPAGRHERETIAALGVARHRSGWAPLDMILESEFDGVPVESASLPWCAGNVLAFHPAIIEALALDLDSQGETLPVRSAAGTYVLFHATTLTDAVDWKRTVVERFTSSGRLMAIPHLVLHEERIPDRPFQIPGFERGSILFPESFVSGLQGLATGTEFACVWPERREV